MDFNRFKMLLDNNYNWPAKYTFKFVVPFEKVGDLKQTLGKGESKEKFSKNGKYMSITFEKWVISSDEVISIYKSTSSIEGLVSL